MSLTEHTEFTERKQKEQRPTFFSVPSVSSSEPCERVRDTSGFSLLEVLVSMAVMVVIIVMVANMYRNASDAWELGVQRAEMNTSARAAMELISRELSCAMAGAMPDSIGGAAVIKEFTLVGGKLLSFTVMSTYTNKLTGVRFNFNNNEYIIKADRYTDSFKPYQSGWAGIDLPGDLLITNVWRFEVSVCSNESDMVNGAVGHAYDSSANSNLLPACVDVTIEMLSERDMARALSFLPASDEQRGFVMTNSRVYTTRVCFPNRGGAR